VSRKNQLLSANFCLIRDYIPLTLTLSPKGERGKGGNAFKVLVILIFKAPINA
jgi:hypothetical protein